MSAPTPAVPSDVKADPKRPWKAIVGAAITFLGLLYVAYQGANPEDFEDWLNIIVPTILTFGGIYVTPNPKVFAASRRSGQGL